MKTPAIRLLPKRASFGRLALGAACSAALAVGAASDIDIFTGNNSASTRKPNVLVILDNSSNWSATLGANSCGVGDTKFDAEVCALSAVAGGLTDSIRLGLMMFNETGTNGGYVRFGIRDMNDQNKNAFSSLVTNMVRNGAGTDASGANQPYGRVMFEAFKYFGGYASTNNVEATSPGSPTGSSAFGPTAFAGLDAAGSKRRDYIGNNAGGITSNTGNRSAIKNGADNFAAFTDASATTYNSPISVAGCEKNFVIVIANGSPSVGGDSGTPSTEQLMDNISANRTQIQSGGVAVDASLMDEMARFMFRTDVSPRPSQQKVITYTLAVYQPQSVAPDGTETIRTTDRAMIKLMRSAASAGGGKYFKATSAAEVVNAIKTILNEVQAVNSVFVSASLPVSVNTQGTFLNQVYMGMFRPDGSGNPRWLGNLKQYQFIFDSTTGELNLGDADSQRVVSAATGFVTPSAKSFWTSSSAYWVNNQTGQPPSASDSPDGEVVEKGGAAQQLRTELANAARQDARRVFTCPAAGCPANAALSTLFDTATISGATYQTAFGAATAGELTSLVRWIRGEDNVNGTPCDPTVAPCVWNSAESGPGWPTTVRPSIHGDVLHSRPVVMNYPSIGPYVFYGANDGTLHAAKGGQAATDGKETWSFVAPDFYAKFKRLKSGIPVLLLPSTLPGIIPLPQEKDYFFDGSIGSYQDATRAWIFVSARRGGRFIYAFDVSDPINPIFMWKISPASTGFARLGQTWSEPKAVKVNGQADPVLIFGAGYDAAAEDVTSPGTTTMGNAVFVVNARTGALIREFDSAVGFGTLQRSIPSDVALVDVDFDGLADRGYVGDMGGNVWRLDVADANSASWQMYRLANLGDTKKFFFQPDVVLSRDFHTVVAGSGDREKPLVNTSIDRFYGLRDTKTAKDGAGLVTILSTDLVASGTAVEPPAKGWYLELLAGEKVVNSPLTIAGVTYFSTNKPVPIAEDSCATNLGSARAYGVDFTSGTAGADRNGDGTIGTDDLFTPLTGGGLPPSPVGGVVELANGKLVGFIIGAGTGGSAIEGGRVRVNIPKTRKKVYWNIKTDK